jgi:AcrR family transcriptional regulator
MNRQKQKERIKELLQQKALELFQSQGYQKTTVLQIAKRAGVAKGTFFNYFRTKEEILYSINEQHMQEIEGELHKLTGTNLLDQLRQLLIKLSEIHEQLGKEVTKSYCFFINQKEHSYFQSLLNVLVPLFEKGKASGEFHSELSTTKLALTFVQLYIGVLHYWCFHASSPSIAQLMNDAFFIFCTGIKKSNKLKNQSFPKTI